MPIVCCLTIESPARPPDSWPFNKDNYQHHCRALAAQLLPSCSVRPIRSIGACSRLISAPLDNCCRRTFASGERANAIAIALCHLFAKSLPRGPRLAALPLASLASWLRRQIAFGAERREREREKEICLRLFAVPFFCPAMSSFLKPSGERKSQSGGTERTKVGASERASESLLV